MTSSDHERWLPVVGHEGFYEVSDLGRVRSVDRQVLRDGPQYKEPHWVTYRSRVLALSRQKHGYIGVLLWKDNRYKNLRVHRLVLRAFIGPCPAGKESLHGNGQRDDNRLANLRYGTSAENHQDRVRHGTAMRDWCKRGHRLAPPNLRQECASRPALGCLACARALSLWYWMERDKPGHGHDKELWLQVRSDAKYAAIMGHEPC